MFVIWQRWWWYSVKHWQVMTCLTSVRHCWQLKRSGPSTGLPPHPHPRTYYKFTFQWHIFFLDFYSCFVILICPDKGCPLNHVAPAHEIGIILIVPEKQVTKAGCWSQYYSRECQDEKKTKGMWNDIQNVVSSAFAYIIFWCNARISRNLSRHGFIVLINVALLVI